MPRSRRWRNDARRRHVHPQAQADSRKDTVQQVADERDCTKAYLSQFDQIRHIGQWPIRRLTLADHPSELPAQSGWQIPRASSD